MFSLAVVLLPALFFPARGAETNAAPRRLKVGIVQMALAPTLNSNCHRIVTGISQVAARGARVAVFPEGALRGEGNEEPGRTKEAVKTIGRAAREQKIYVLFGGASRSARTGKESCWLSAFGPDGAELFHYDKLYDRHDAKMPGVFAIDGIPCSALLCADRWLRGVEEIPIQQGAQISFELSCNFASEWIAPYEWYWNVPRALRNNVWVIFANTGNNVSGVPNHGLPPRALRHGHSAVIAPNGNVLAAASSDVETIVIADLDLSQATHAEARRRFEHPALRAFWEAGLKLQRGQPVQAPNLTPLSSPPAEITLAIAQATNGLSEMLSMVRAAGEKKADLVAFPARAMSETALPQFRQAAREQGIVVVVGLIQPGNGKTDAAYVIGPDGSVLTRYEAISEAAPGGSARPAAMWFQVKGVPGIVTVGRDALWTELAELAAVAGAQIMIHLENDGTSGKEAELRRLQIWSNHASFHTFTATANVIGSALWDDLRDMEERQAEVRGLPQPDTGRVEVYSPFSANLIVRAGREPQLLLATRRVSRTNPHYPRRTSNLNPQMDAWYRLGASLVQPRSQW